MTLKSSGASRGRSSKDSSQTKALSGNFSFGYI
nr:MAG TPA: hypothetical protein [Caudoviricetes sp.]